MRITLYVGISALLLLLYTAKNLCQHVKVFHYTSIDWGYSKEGIEPCGYVHCDWTNSASMGILAKRYKEMVHEDASIPPTTVSVSVFNIHYLWASRRAVSPQVCELNATFTVAESEESKTRFFELQTKTQKHFDGLSTTASQSSIPRVYEEAHLNVSLFLPIRPFQELIKGASYIASNCHRHDRWTGGADTNSKRDSIVHSLRIFDIRVDGLARCMRSNGGPENVVLETSKDARENLVLKRKAISNYLFDLSFENSIEQGYVTEKGFDALFAGIVPVYLGDAIHLRSLLPHPKAAIFVKDFKDTEALAKYLLYLSKNKSAYEEHRHWRDEFLITAKQNGGRNDSQFYANRILQQSWFCAICKWAVNMSSLSFLNRSISHTHRRNHNYHSSCRRK